MDHREYIVLALSYGANVMCEKPLAFTKRGALEMLTVRKAKASLMACQSMRFTAYFASLSPKFRTLVVSRFLEGM
jgi:predicted dehydrogenase